MSEHKNGKLIMSTSYTIVPVSKTERPSKELNSRVYAASDLHGMTVY